MTKGEELYLQGALEEAHSLLLKEAEEGNGRAMYMLAQYSLQGLFLAGSQPLTAAAWFQKGAALSPLCRIGAAFFEKKEMADKEEISRAAEEVKEAARRGDVLAMVCAAYLCRGIEGILPEEPGQRLAYLTKAADAHFWQAENDLGLIYLNGRETAQDNEKGFGLLARAAAAGIGTSEYHLAFCWLHGIGTARDEHKGIAFYQRAWKHGCGKAAIELGMQYESGAVVKADPKKAFQLYKKAADMGLAEGKAHLGDCYYDGKGTKADRKKAGALYEAASKAGDAYGMLRMGQLAMSKGNFERAFLQFYQAARTGLPAAQYLTGLCLIRGIGVAEDRTAGTGWLRRAAERGSKEALEVLAQIG